MFSERVCAAASRRVLGSLVSTHTNASRPITRHFLRGKLRASVASTPRRTFASGPTAGLRDEEPSAGRQQHQQPRRTHAALRLATGVIAAWLALNAALELCGLDEWLTALRVGKPLNETRFVPFVVVSRDQVSPTGFILTVKPKFSLDSPDTSPSGQALSILFPRLRFPHELHTSRPVLEKAWHHGLWSVEIKQPQLQVARDYTPLPAASRALEQEDLKLGHLRFLIRQMDGGEVSTYLSRLQVGNTVELRGPHLGFDIRTRLGSADKVVFLAGGTGIAPALQTARAFSDTETTTSSSKPSVSILWANRHRADCPGIDPPSSSSSSAPKLPPSAAPTTNTIVSFLAQMKARYGDKLNYASTVDDENTRISSRDVLSAAGNPSPTPTTSTTWSFPFFTTTRQTQHPQYPTPAPGPVPVDASACQYHSAARLVSSGGSDAIFDADGETRCGCLDARGGKPVAPGKNLLMVSGPDGFIGAFAGPKRWADGMERQGSVGGLVGSLWEASPGFWANWLVLKL